MQGMMAAEYSRAFLRDIMRQLATYSAQGMLYIVQLARGGDPEAHATLIEMYTEMTNRRELPPAVLANYAMESRVGFRGRRGRRKIDHFYRDVAIVVTVNHLVERFGLSPTRNSASRSQPSACSIIAGVLGDARIGSTGEKAVEIIWNRLAKICFPRTFGAS
jgi:hypothetical protein